MRDLKFIVILIMLAILGIIVIGLLFPPVQASYYVQQGDTIYLNDTVDISGAIGWPNDAGDYHIAYYGRSGTEMDPQHIIKFTKKSQRYSFYIDPEIFSQRIGPWFQYYGNTSENHGNLLIFNVVSGTKNTTPIKNTTLQNPNQTPMVIKEEILPKKHVSDYLIARGDNFKIKVAAPTNAWIFGYRDKVYDYRSVNNTISFTKEVISGLSAGTYTMLLQNHKNGTDFTVRYNKDQQTLEWFDPASFKINSYSISDKPPQEVLKKMRSIFPTTTDTFKEVRLEVEEPTISINQIDSTFMLNATKEVEYVGLDNIAFLDVRGYTNHMPDTIIKVMVDPVFNVSGIDSWKDALTTKSEGTDGDMRAWRITVPVEKYNMAPGRHFMGAKVGDVITTADFYLYSNPENSYVPNKTIRYISGRYGDQEIIPTPTPIVVEKTVLVPTIVTVTIPVTPPDEQVYAQQLAAQKKINDDNWTRGTVITIAVIGFVVFVLVGIYLIRVYWRAKK